uniref:Uncharacterized protein n=1 Tax=Haptolina brevifila TaxID=156173 RepID=A0A7S2H0W6_9EUKA|mmetsp:Transcript_49937/g.99426  ORF Transcript_49937/g.99426 Transcript_49937/m.99426 type:complete len:181 (+) Transcript_49937:109-651(+)|eukprot:CAMPEP_0174712102 /NCGR_PEP_ID=MMETSP1094-20130205/13206_1 /TAXON_ID=156173 /ORGANISM="Chrysochromulina brevifilum, Strain UTEX LB 985" /LENGTH=180 /DNA_ID=CAMNT_0015911127 /DNA_START=101 /DNA_END=643 /DNA_ORIENTATION=+
MVLLSRSRADFSQHVVLFGIVLTTIAIARLDRGIPKSVAASTPWVTQEQAEAIAYKVSPGIPANEAIQGIVTVLTDDYCYTLKQSNLDNGMQDIAADADTHFCGIDTVLSFEDDYGEDTDTIVSPISVKGNIISYNTCSRGKDVVEGGLKVENMLTIVKVGSELKVKFWLSVVLATCDAK